MSSENPTAHIDLAILKQNLEQKLSEGLGIDNLLIQDMTLEPPRHRGAEVFATFQSRDIAASMQPPMFKHLYLYASRLRASHDDEEHWCLISWRFELYTLGTNGCDAAQVVIDVDGSIREISFTHQKDS